MLLMQKPDSCVLPCQAPKNDRGAPINNYIIERFDSDTDKCIKAATSRFHHCTIENLLPNKPYQFLIFAENIFRAGELSKPTKTVLTSSNKNSMESQE